MSPEEQALVARLMSADVKELVREAGRLRDQGKSFITFSPKVFLPLTRLCRDSCGYCTFARPPRPGVRAFMTIQEVLEVAQQGAEQGCTEALFTLGDKPELRWPEAALELQSLGFISTLDYVHHAAHQVHLHTGLLPHINAGVMGQEDLSRLRKVSVSQGLMLESTSHQLLGPGQPHDLSTCPDKAPLERLKTIEAAGRAGVPFTSGVLIGIGESREERLHALLAIHRLHQHFGHIQEIIVQNFRSKPNTPMWLHPEPSLEELVWTVAAARIIRERNEYSGPPQPHSCGGPWRGGGPASGVESAPGRRDQ